MKLLTTFLCLCFLCLSCGIDSSNTSRYAVLYWDGHNIIGDLGSEKVRWEEGHWSPSLDKQTNVHHGFANSRKCPEALDCSFDIRTGFENLEARLDEKSASQILVSSSPLAATANSAFYARSARYVTLDFDKLITDKQNSTGEQRASDEQIDCTWVEGISFNSLRCNDNADEKLRLTSSSPKTLNSFLSND